MPETPPPSVPAAADEFFVGYLAPVPRDIARRSRLAVVAILVLSTLAALAVATTFRDPGDGVWHLPETTEIVGVLSAHPYPMLRVDAPPPSAAGSAPAVREVLVVEAGKHGAQDRATSADGKRVRLTGNLIQRGPWSMIELSPAKDAIRVEPGAGEPGSASTAASRRPARLVGEIVDPKCYLGVMKPGDGKTHLGCAARCIASGIPPLLLTKSGRGGQVFLLVAADGGPVNEAVLPWVGQPVEVSGETEDLGADRLPRLWISGGGITPAPRAVSSPGPVPERRSGREQRP